MEMFFAGLGIGYLIGAVVTLWVALRDEKDENNAKAWEAAFHRGWNAGCEYGKNHMEVEE